MNTKVKSLWVSKLRSGEYTQGRRCLTYGNSFCCLGVLTDLYLKAHNLEWHNGNVSGYSLNLPSVVCVWAGLRSNDPRVSIREGVQMYDRPLSNVNDSGVPFSVIADLIEAQL